LTAALRQGRLGEPEHALSRVRADYEADTNAATRMCRTFDLMHVVPQSADGMPPPGNDSLVVAEKYRHY
jgi:hypothetical protein